MALNPRSLPGKEEGGKEGGREGGWPFRSTAEEEPADETSFSFIASEALKEGREGGNEGGRNA